MVSNSELRCPPSAACAVFAACCALLCSSPTMGAFDVIRYGTVADGFNKLRLECW